MHGIRSRLPLGVAIAIVTLGSDAAAQGGGVYDLGWSTLDCGGGPAAGGAILLQASIGQPDTGVATGGSYTLTGGFVSEDPDVPSSIDVAELPTSLRLHPSSPNPLTTESAIAFELPQAGPVRLDVIAADGSLVARLLDTTLPAGRHVARWNGDDQDGIPVARGVYLVRFAAGRHIQSQKLVVAR